MNPKQQPLFTIQEAEADRPSRLLLIIAMLILLAVVLTVSFKLVTPKGASFGFTNRHGRLQLAEADRLERDSLFRSAAEIYTAVMDNDRLNDELRRKAAMRLVAIYSDHLRDPAKAEIALEKAYARFADGPEREALRRRLEALSGRQVGSTDPSPFLAEAPESPDESEAVARIGGRPVTLDEILFAWREYRGSAPPEGQAFADFVDHYLNLVLLAQQAQDLKLDQQGRTALDLNLKRITVLNSALTQYMIQKLPTPDEAAIEEFYQANTESFSQPASAVIGHIVAGDEETARKVMDALKAGEETFEAIARRHSLDAGELEDGCRLGEVYANQQKLPGLGDMPGLAAELVTMKDGETTGPMATGRGVHWVKVYETRRGEPMPLDAIRDQVLFAYQKVQLMRQRGQLVESLKKQYPIEIMKVENGQAPAIRPDAPAAAQADDPATTGTQTNDVATTAATHEE